MLAVIDRNNDEPARSEYISTHFAEQFSCSFCRKQQDQVQRLIAGPGEVSICDECVAALSSGPEAPQDEQGLRCSFCGKHQQQVSYLAIGPHGVNICNTCLVLCREIIAEEGLHQA